MDAISEKDAFKLGFLARCAEEQLVGPALDARIKRAAEKQSGTLKDILSGLATGVGVAGAAGLAGGAGIGYGLAHATTPRISDDEIRAQELAQTYRIYADRARAKNRMKKKYREVR